MQLIRVIRSDIMHVQSYFCVVCQKLSLSRSRSLAPKIESDLDIVSPFSVTCTYSSHSVKQNCILDGKFWRLKRFLIIQCISFAMTNFILFQKNPKKSFALGREKVQVIAKLAFQWFKPNENCHPWIWRRQKFVSKY